MLTMTQIWGPSDTQELIRALADQGVPTRDVSQEKSEEIDHRSTFVD